MPPEKLPAIEASKPARAGGADGRGAAAAAADARDPRGGAARDRAVRRGEDAGGGAVGGGPVGADSDREVGRAVAADRGGAAAAGARAVAEGVDAAAGGAERAGRVPREPSQKIATQPPAPAAAPGAKKSASSIRGADPLVPAAVGAGPSTDCRRRGRHRQGARGAAELARDDHGAAGDGAAEGGGAEAAPSRSRRADGRSVAAAVTMLPPSPSPAPKPEPRMEPLRPERARRDAAEGARGGERPRAGHHEGAVGRGAAAAAGHARAAADDGARGDLADDAAGDVARAARDPAAHCCSSSVARRSA